MKTRFILALLVSTVILSACGTSFAEATPTVTATATLVPTATVTPTETPIPTPTVPPFYLTATVWVQEPRVPIVNYHQFAPDYAKKSTDHKVRFEDFIAEMTALDQAGFTLVSVEDWLDGQMVVPAGRRPLVFTMDDLFYNNQIRLDENGEPLPDTGLGIAWQFYQEHPQFGFQWALFSNLGDKLYANPDDPGWQDELGSAIAWSIDHNARVYNHTYQHVRLDKSEPADIIWQLQANDQYLRELLTRVGREDLIPGLGNMLAIPFGYWPNGDGGQRVIREYTSPEGLPMQAVFDIDYLVRAAYLGFPFGPNFDKYHIPRLALPPEVVPYLVENKDAFPAAATCQLGPLDESQIGDPAYLGAQIEASIAGGTCPPGYYVVQGQTFDARNGAAQHVYP
ncbi:MAG: hypothetical protein GXP40_02935 [Chloroflexi bacterium]|nr:hypothetical protein [Chloroflexota bacterium]